jgi:hypothetical protein
MSEYTMKQFHLYNVARQAGAEQAVTNLQVHISALASEAGEAWLTDPRRVPMEEALAVLRSHAGGRHILDEASLAEVELLAVMAADRDKRLQS